MLKNYDEFKDNMIMRDFLALDRTILANERTLLAYIRTFIGVFSAGVAIVKLLDFSAATVIGFAFIVLSPSFLIIGVYRYAYTARKFRAIVENEQE